MRPEFGRGHRIHILGIGGAGMSGLARLALEWGTIVTGADERASQSVDDLRHAGIDISVPQSEGVGNSATWLTTSPAIAMDNPEVVDARTHAVPIFNRADVFSSLSGSHDMVAFAGTHGKTTATSMAVCVWLSANRDPSWLLGAAVRGVGFNAHGSASKEILVECDESFGTLTRTSPAMLGLLNVDADHLDFYGSQDAIDDAFRGLVERTSGPVVGWLDDPGVARVIAAAQRKIVSAGRNAGEYRVSDERAAARGTQFTLSGARGSMTIDLNVPGAHNVENAAVVAGLALEAGIEPSAVIRGLANFVGAPRRFDVLGTIRGTTIVDDYAHLPNEIRATITAARDCGFPRIVAIFQPHRVTRTAALTPLFADCFLGVDELIVTDIYASGEENPEGLTGEMVATAVRDSGTVSKVTYVPTIEKARERAAAICGLCDALLLLGAGDIDQIGPSLVAQYCE